ncbi:Adenylosuccinate synthetase [Patellaria atrata CBS 101060]|uniref:Adenylosuccinate synthetase n=1 Tax=Patellaria atrata CBS 101060 TaxID=1346257 RepID=A0A9P4VQG4_9PEZI|nr:Adenylosuccinate synthetase [Patellaria atrata CBS 101060]
MPDPNISIVLGSQFGDEGKGKLVDILTETADVCCRCQGGNNAGHTIVANGVKYSTRLLPSGIVNPRTENFIGTGVVVHIPSLFEELDGFQDKAMDVSGRIFISSRAHIVLDLHQLVDGLQEQALGEGSVGTTKRGIGPTYASKANRSGLQIQELDLDAWDFFEARFRRLVKTYRMTFGDLLSQYDEEGELAKLKGLAPRVKPLVVDAVTWLDSRIQAGKRVLVEGAQSLMLDLDMGTYPYVTSSNSGLGGVFTGLSISPFQVRKIVGVTKAYLTRVGSGPMPTELEDEFGEHLQKVGQEFGVNTGRRRRCGWLDLVMLKHSTMANHYTTINFTKLDVLDGLSEIKVATAYQLPDGTELRTFPANLKTLATVKPVYKTFPGWTERTAGSTSYNHLPQQAKDYIAFVEEFIGVKIGSIGCGPSRENMIFRQIV